MTEWCNHYDPLMPNHEHTVTTRQYLQQKFPVYAGYVS